MHIEVANRSDYGRATMKHYDSHPLAYNSDDEKHLENAEREAGRAANKCRQGGGDMAKCGTILVDPGIAQNHRQWCHPLHCLKDNLSHTFWDLVLPVEALDIWRGPA